MLSSNNAPVIVRVEKTTAGKSLVAKVIGLFAHLGWPKWFSLPIAGLCICAHGHAMEREAQWHCRTSLG